MMHWKTVIEEVLTKKLNTEVRLVDIAPVGGGSINEAYRLDTRKGIFFAKINNAKKYPQMFEKEALGLKLLRETNTLGVPEVFATGNAGKEAFLLLPFIASKAQLSDFWRLFGEQLATLHSHSQPTFGLDHDNYIGSLVQTNGMHDSWTPFFIEERLEPQLRLARDQGRVGSSTTQAFQRFYNRLDELFPAEPPALLHGDLWSGNFMVGDQGEPVLIDPAVYYGHREMDLAMSQLFGGFSPSFYEAYHAHYPLEKGWQKRLDYCNLYPLMVHVNLFGGSYLESVKAILNPF
jgi:fructosamine-3-kinase